MQRQVAARSEHGTAYLSALGYATLMPLPFALSLGFVVLMLGSLDLEPLTYAQQYAQHGLESRMP